MQYSLTTPVVGIAMDRFDNAYQATVVRGIAEAARERGANVLAFVGGQLEQDGGSALRNCVFDLIGPESVDAVVLLGAVLSHGGGREAVEALAGRWAPLPTCSVASTVPGAGSVEIDNEAGMRDALEHLFGHHARRRVAFVRGPRSNLEAEQRFAVYRQALERAGLTFDERLVCQGDFARGSGAEAVRELLDVRALSVHDGLDALVAANDDMACGALEELTRRGLRVPRDLALIGFDDSQPARFAQPPLTTVRQPEAELGREALRQVLAPRGARAPSSVLPTELVRRRSCGCFGEAQISVAPLAAGAVPGFQVALLERRQILLAELARAARGQFGALGRGWEARLLGALTDDLLSAGETFLDVHDDVVDRCLQGHADVDACHDVLSVLRRHVMACAAGDAERRLRADRLLDEGRIAIGRAAERMQASERIALAAHVPGVSEASVELASARSLAELGRALGRHAELGVTECHLVLADHDEHRLALSHSERRGLRFPGVHGNARNLLRRALPEHGHHALAVLPLFARERHLGYAAVTLGARLPIPHEALRMALSHALDAMSA